MGGVEYILIGKFYLLYNQKWLIGTSLLQLEAIRMKMSKLDGLKCPSW